VARILLVGGGCRGLDLAAELTADGHAVRMTTRREARREPIEKAGAECWIGDPDRVGTLRYALESVTVLCWLLGTATGPVDQVAALHQTRLEMMLARTIDTTVRGLVYEAAGTVDPAALARGEEVIGVAAATWGIPVEVLRVPREDPAWVRGARESIERILAP
jgi:hypothetical protein